METPIFDKLLGMFMGGFIGDALGAPFELRGSINIVNYTGLLQYPIVIRNRFQNEPTTYQVGTFTDDSQMTLYLIKSIINNKGKYIKDKVTLSYMEFANQTKMLGRNTRKLLKGIKTLRGYNNRVTKFMDSSIESNGSMMRVSPLSIYKDYNIWLVDSSITNTSLVNYVCNVIYLYGIRYAIEGKSKDDIKELYISLSKQYNIESIITAVNQAISGEIRNVDERMTNSDGLLGRRTNKGWVVHGIYASLWSLLHFDDYRNGIDSIILLGGDTDTLAKIAGDFLGAFYGYSTIMSNDITKNNGNIVFNVNSDYLNTFVSDVHQLSRYYQF